MPILLAVGMWLLFLVMAVLNGIVRDALAAPILGETAARLLSTLILAGAIWVFTGLFLRRCAHRYTPRGLLWMGVLWCGATVAFECVLGRVIAGLSWAEVLADYNILRGRLWLLIPLSVLTAPSVMGRLPRRTR